jgi:hypothetical protein
MSLSINGNGDILTLSSATVATMPMDVAEAINV